MKKILLIEFNPLECPLENLVRITALISSKYSNNLKKIELVPTLEENYKIYLDKVLLLSKSMKEALTEEELNTLILSQLEINENKNSKEKIDCFGWKCSDVLRKTDRD